MNTINISKTDHHYTINHYDGIHISRSVTVTTPIDGPTSDEERIVAHIERCGLVSAQLVELDMDTMQAVYLNTPPRLPDDLPYYIRHMTEEMPVVAVQIYPDNQGVRYVDVLGPSMLVHQRAPIEKSLYLAICNEHETTPYRNPIYDSVEDTILLSSPIHPESQIFMLNPIPIETAATMCLHEMEPDQLARMQAAIVHYLNDHPDEVNRVLDTWRGGHDDLDYALTHHLLLYTDTEVHQFIDRDLDRELNYMVKVADDMSKQEEVEIYL